MRTQPHVEQSMEIIDRMTARARRPLLAYSGGKDAVVVALLLLDAGVPFHAVCESSHYFPQMRADARMIARELGFPASVVSLLPFDFVDRHPHVIFTSDSSVAAWWMARRQQRTARMWAKKHGHDVVVFGRRLEENTVPGDLYETKTGLQ